MRRLQLRSLRKPLIFVCFLVASAVGQPWATAEQPPAEPRRVASLAELVPADAGLCVETDRLAEHVARFMNGPLFERVSHFPPLAKWVGRNGAQIALAKAEFQKRLGASPAEAWTGILGGRALFAVWPPKGDGDSGPALLLVEAKDRKLLARVLDNFVAMQREAGKWKQVSTLEHAGRRCEVHVISGENRDQLFLASIDDLAIAANDEELIRETLALSAGKVGPRGALAALSGYVAGNRRLSGQTALRLFVNPRPWDAGLLADLARKPPESREAQAQKTTIETWQAADYVVAGVEFGSQITVETFAAWRTSALPPAVREAAECVSGRAALAERIPKNALLAIAGRVDWGRLIWRFAPVSRARVVKEEKPPSAALLGVPAEWLLPASLAHGIGPDFGAYLAPRTPQGAEKYESRLPLDLVAVLHSRPLEPGDGRPALARLAEPMLHSLLTSAAAATNAQSAEPTASLEAVELGGLTMTAFGGVPGPRGHPLSAAYAVVGDDFWLASSPAALHRGVELRAPDSLAQSPPFDRLPDASQLLHVDLQGLRQLLASSPEVVEFLAASKGLDRDAARRSFRELLALAELADSASAAVRLDETGVAACVCFAAQPTLAGEAPAGAASE
jgi:hypothetical protein